MGPGSVLKRQHMEQKRTVSPRSRPALSVTVGTAIIHPAAKTLDKSARPVEAFLRRLRAQPSPERAVREGIPGLPFTSRTAFGPFLANLQLRYLRARHLRKADVAEASYRRKIRFSDTDQQGIVFNANYLVYVDDALTDLFESVGLPFGDLAGKGYDVVVARVECDFRSAASIGETLITRVWAGSAGNTSIVFSFRITEELSGRTVAEGNEVYVVLDSESRTPERVPDIMREAFDVP